jgi:hypothetical protein
MNPATGMQCESVALVAALVEDLCELQYSLMYRKQHMVDDFIVMHERTTE